MALALAADRTSTIGLGPAVLVPSLRHPMANATATATLARMAPAAAVAFGAGFTGRYTLGQRPLRWADVEAYVAAVRGLLRGETVTWEGAPIRMMHTDGFVADRPVDVPVYIGADGPKGTAVAEHARRRRVLRRRPQHDAAAGRPQALLRYGTVLGAGRGRPQRAGDGRRRPRRGGGVPRPVRAGRPRHGAGVPRRRHLAGRRRGGPRARAPPRHARGPPRAAHRRRPGRGPTRGPTC